MSDFGSEKDAMRVAERLRKQRAVLAEFGLHAFRSDDLDPLLNEAATLVSRALDVDYVKVLELLPDRERFLIRAGTGWEPGVVGHATIGANGDSPGGHALETGDPVASEDLSEERRFKIPEILIEHGVQSVVNVLIAGVERPFGVLEVDSREKRAFNDDDIAFLRNYANLIAAAVERLEAHVALQQWSEDRQHLVLELQHRVKNILALVQSLAMQTATADRTAGEYREAFMGRLQALARAHGLLFEEAVQKIGLATLIERALEPHRADAADTVVLSGPAVTINAKQALTLGLILHEFATNAAKYGALAAAQGCVRVDWATEDRGGRALLHLTWREQGGPVVEKPQRRGFGTRMINRATELELKGVAELVYHPDGLQAEVIFPLDQEIEPVANP